MHKRKYSLTSAVEAAGTSESIITIDTSLPRGEMIQKNNESLSPLKQEKPEPIEFRSPSLDPVDSTDGSASK